MVTPEKREDTYEISSLEDAEALASQLETVFRDAVEDTDGARVVVEVTEQKTLPWFTGGE